VWWLLENMPSSEITAWMVEFKIRNDEIKSVSHQEKIMHDLKGR